MCRNLAGVHCGGRADAGDAGVCYTHEHTTKVVGLASTQRFDVLGECVT